jgi:hypothetical protein
MKYRNLMQRKFQSVETCGTKCALVQQELIDALEGTKPDKTTDEEWR